MNVTQVALRPTPASEAAGRPSLTPELLAASGARYSRKYLKGVGRREGAMFMVLDANEVFADVEPELGEAPEGDSEEHPIQSPLDPQPDNAPST